MVKLEKRRVDFMQRGVVRISVTLPAELYKSFDRAAKAMGYKKRSRAVGDALQKFVADYKTLEEMGGGICAGTITYTYEHDIRGLLDALTDLQHEYSEVINTSLHVHLDKENCLETLAISGNVTLVKELIKKLKTLKVRNVQYILVPRL
jgi:CopG family nickel-responsive transcriptional regulator